MSFPFAVRIDLPHRHSASQPQKPLEILAYLVRLYHGIQLQRIQLYCPIRLEATLRLDF